MQRTVRQGQRLYGAEQLPRDGENPAACGVSGRTRQEGGQPARRVVFKLKTGGRQIEHAVGCAHGGSPDAGGRRLRLDGKAAASVVNRGKADRLPNGRRQTQVFGLRRPGERKAVGQSRGRVVQRERAGQGNRVVRHGDGRRRVGETDVGAGDYLHAAEIACR